MDKRMLARVFLALTFVFTTIAVSLVVNLNNRQQAQAAPAGTDLMAPVQDTMAPAKEKAQPPENPNVILMNDNGQSYGTFAAAGGLGGDLPDLISVQATNGEFGYITREDFHSSSREAHSPAEAMEIMTGYQRNTADGFCEYVLADTGVGIDRDAFYDLLGELGCWWNGWAELTAQQQAAVVSMLPEGHQSTVLASAAYSNAIKSNDVKIPVYAQDGTTVIGEFIVGFGS